MIDAALVMLKPKPNISDSEMNWMLHLQTNGWMPSSMDADAVDAAVRYAIADTRKKFDVVSPPRWRAADEAARSRDFSQVSRVFLS